MKKLASFLALVFPAVLTSCSCYKQKQELEQPPQAISQSIVKEILNPEEFDNNTLGIIKFYRTSCPACHMSAQPYEELAQKNKSITFYAVDVDKDGTLKTLHAIRALPTFIAFDRGNKVATVVGFNTPQLTDLINKLSSEKTPQVHITHITSPEHLTKELTKDKVIVKFFSNECGFCKMIAPVYEGLAKTYGNHVTFLAVDVDAQSELSSQYAPNGVPVFFTFKAGKQVDKVLGARADELERIVKELAQTQSTTDKATEDTPTPED